MPKSFRVASFNALNLLESGVFFAGRKDEDAYPEAIYEAKVEWIVRTLKDAQADLVGFQELFSERAFREVTTKAGLSHTFIPDLVGGKNMQPRANGGIEARGPFVGLASRFPILEADRIREFPEGTANLAIQPLEGGPTVDLPFDRFQRPVIRAKVQLRDDVSATVFVAHLKSKRIQILSEEVGREREPMVVAAGSARALMIRAAEAVALRKLIIDATQGTTTPVILFGDLNDDLSSVTTQIIGGEEPFRFAKPAEQQAVVDRLLYSVHDIEENESYRDVSYSHIFNGRYELLDHIFVSRELYHRHEGHIAAVRITRIFNDHLFDERRVVNPGRGPSPRSDHGIPVTEIEWR
ncbi:MAG: endonuclease/exonuclease/phosphatase family protein [Myxococcales bacterium]|nr:endonuclease/exonuclease/phosphatase family protein [Myxococcales bacterium]